MPLPTDGDRNIDDGALNILDRKKNERIGYSSDDNTDEDTSSSDDDVVMDDGTNDLKVAMALATTTTTDSATTTGVIDTDTKIDTKEAQMSLDAALARSLAEEGEGDANDEQKTIDANRKKEVELKQIKQQKKQDKRAKKRAQRRAARGLLKRPANTWRAGAPHQHTTPSKAKWIEQFRKMVFF
jgi:hypothetical protein